MPLRSTLLALLLVAVVACGSRPAQGPASDELSIHYALETKQPPLHVLVDIPGHGTARVALLRALPHEPQGLAGYFNLELSSAQRAKLERRIDQGHLLGRNDEPDLGESIGGFLRLERGRHHAEVSLGAKDEATRDLRRLLDDIVSEAAGHPLAALRLVAHARKDEAVARVEASFVHVGVKPLEVAVTPEAEPTAVLHLRIVLERGGRLVNEQESSPDDTRRLVARGKLPAGWHRVEPGKALSLPPLSMPLPQDETGLFVRVEASLRVKTEHREPIDIVLTSPSVSLGEEIRD